MYHFFDAITNNKGDALIGYYVKVIDQTTLSVVNIYADANLTPIVSVSGVANAAKVDSDGNVSLYVSSGNYHLDIYATDATTFIKRIQNVGMVEAAAINVATRTALASLTTGQSPAYLTEGGREGMFVFSSANLSTQVTADTQQAIYVAPISDATGASGAWVRKFDGPISLFWFGAVGNGTADDTAALNAFFAKVATTGCGLIPIGTFKFTSALTAVVGNNITISGEGENSVLLYGGASTTPGDLLTFGDGTTTYYGLYLSGFTVGSVNALTAGAGLRIKKMQYAHVDLVLNGPTGYQGNLYQGAYATNTNYLYFERSRIFARNKCVLLSSCLEVHMGYAWIACVTTSGTTGIHLAGNNSAFYSDRVSLISCQYGLMIDNAVSASPNIQIFLGPAGMIDSCVTAAVYVNDTGTATISKFIHADGWFSSSSAGSGLVVVAFTGGKILSATGTFINNSAAGINIQDNSITLVLGAGVRINDNGGYGVTASAAITISNEAIPLNNASGAFHTNVTVGWSRYGPQAYNISPAANWVHNYVADTLTVANGANAVLAVGAGKIIVCNPNNGDIGEYNVGGGGVTFVGSTAGTWVAPTTTPAAGKTSITWNGSNGYNLYNNFGSQQAFVVALVAKLRAAV